MSNEENMIIESHVEYIKKAVQNGYGLKSHGFIYKVLNGFSAILVKPDYIKDGIVLKKDFHEADYKAYQTKYIKENSLIEFRYEYEAHCRDIDNDYWVIDASILALKCIPFAKINLAIKSGNKFNLKEILEQKEYVLMG